MSRSPAEELTHYLSDMYAVEQQALAQLVSAPKLAGAGAFARDLRIHEEETEQQATRVAARLEARGGSPSVIKDAIMRLGGKGFLLFAKVMPETPGRLLAHCYSYEAMEWAGYRMLEGLALQAGDLETAAVAREIAQEEREMMERLEAHFTATEAISHAELAAEEMAAHVQRHLAEAHALEMQSVQLMDKSREIAEAASLSEVCIRYAEQSRRHAEAIERSLRALGGGPSIVEDSALAMMGYNWGLFFQAQTDTPAKLAAFVYAVGHLKIGGYELLRRTAMRAGELGTANLAGAHIEEERGMAEQVAEVFPGAVKRTVEVAAS